MLEKIRRNVRHPYIQALLGLVIIVFIFFFGWSMQSQRPSYVARVNGETIDYRTYEDAYNGLVRFYRDTYKDDLTAEQIRQMGLGRRALDQLIDRVLLLEAADHRNLKVTESELQNAIASVPAFQDKGGFNVNRYTQVLQANRMTPLEFEASQKRELLLAKLEQAVKAEATVSDSEVEEEYRERNTKIVIEFAALRPKDFEPAVEVTPEELADFYEAEKESFRTPEKRSARYILFSVDSFLETVRATDEEARSEYNWRSGEFAVTEAVHARHILIRAPQDATEQAEAEVKKKAEAIREEILAGGDFSELAKQHSEDPGSRDLGGDLGYFERGQMVSEFEQAAFALPAGTTSEPVKTQFGYHLIQVLNHRQARQPSFEDVKDQILADIKHRKALELAYTEANNVLMDLEDGKTSWKDLAKTHKIEKTPLVTRDGTLEGVDKRGEFVEALFSLDSQKPGDLIETQQGTELLAAEEVVPSGVPPLDAVKAEAEARYRQVEARKLAEKRAKEFLDAARTKSWDEAIKDFPLTPQKTEAFPKKGGAVPKIGWAPQLKGAAFALTGEDPVAKEPFDVNGSYWVIRLIERTEPNLTELEAQREKLRSDLLPRAQAERFQSFLAELRSTAKIKINEDLVR